MGKKYDFLFKKISMSKSQMGFWLRTPEFLEIIDQKIDCDEIIDNKVVFEIIKTIYFQNQLSRERGLKVDGFNYSGTRSGLKKLSEVLTGDRNSWEEEYIKYKESMKQVS